MRTGSGVSARGLPTPDGRYLVVAGVLWRRADPGLAPERRRALVKQLMDARRGLRGADPRSASTSALRCAVDAAKQALGERGPVWWQDGAPDLNRRRVEQTPYAEWFAALADGDRAAALR